MIQSTDLGSGPARRRIGSSFAVNVVGLLVPTLLGLVIVPIYIGEIGVERYGIMSLVWILVGGFGFLDLGISRASANALSKVAWSGPAERSPILGTALRLNFILGMAGALALYVAAHWVLLGMAEVSESLRQEIEAAIPWIAGLLPLSMLSGVVTGALESRDKFVASNIISASSAVLGQAVPIVCALTFGPSLTVLVPSAFFTRLLCTAVAVVYMWVTERLVGAGSFDTRTARTLLGYGSWVSISGVISPILDTIDQAVIGWILGPAAVGYYSAPMNLAARSLFIASALAKTVFPRLSRTSAEDAGALTTKSILFLGYGFAAICAPASLLASPFLALWLGSEFASQAAPVAIILMFGAWCNGIAFIPFSFIQGRGRPDVCAKIHAAEVVPFLAALWLLISWLGLPGAALAWSGRVSIDLLLMLAAAKQMNTRIAGLIPAALVVGGSSLIAFFAQPSPVIAVVLAISAVVTIIISALISEPSARLVAAAACRATLSFARRT